MSSPVDGYYFTTRYPGEDSIFVDKEDMDICMEAIELCRDITLDAIRKWGVAREQPRQDELETALEEMDID